MIEKPVDGDDQLLMLHVEEQMAKRPTLVFRFRDEFDKQNFISRIGRDDEIRVTSSSWRDPVIDIEVVDEDG